MKALCLICKTVLDVDPWEQAAFSCGECGREWNSALAITSFDELSKKSGQGLFIDNGVLTAYLGEYGDIEIPSGVREIGDKAFKNSYLYNKVVIPDGVARIGDEAFLNCEDFRE
ncbi:MAG: leucine-rich repeat domain-containing protein, partial [Clostridiales bacterium]|nr:leucine-rich repeat domain-containing protein [Clostridiales bacterium]